MPHHESGMTLLTQMVSEILFKSSNYLLDKE